MLYPVELRAQYGAAIACYQLTLLALSANRLHLLPSY